MKVYKSYCISFKMRYIIGNCLKTVFVCISGFMVISLISIVLLDVKHIKIQHSPHNVPDAIVTTKSRYINIHRNNDRNENTIPRKVDTDRNISTKDTKRMNRGLDVPSNPDDNLSDNVTLLHNGASVSFPPPSLSSSLHPDVLFSSCSVSPVSGIPHIIHQAWDDLQVPSQVIQTPTGN